MSKTISILGCGWLGLPLAIRLIISGWEVKGSTTNDDKIKLLNLNEIEAYLVQLHDLQSTDIHTFLKSEILLINVPPSLKKQSPVSYLDQMAALVEAVKASDIKKIIFISSTSVYPEVNATITDTEEVDENSVVLQSERLFTECLNFKTTVIRFGGLFGPGRHPSRFFAGKTDVPNGKAPVNLIHLDDCIGIIETVLNHDDFGKVYHAAAPSHPSRNDFYTTAVQKAGLVEPEFVDELSDWKIIDPVKIQTALNYKFIHPDLLSSLV